MSKSELHDWECEIEELSGNNADKMLGIARDIYKTAFVRGRNSMTWEQTRWIPVSEKLPEEDGDYLLWGKIDEDEDEYTFIGSYDSGCEEFGIWQEQFDRTTLGCLGSDFFEYASVTAWMPLPEPYKAEMESGVCKGCHYNDGEVHAECVVCDKAEMEGEE